MGQKRLWEFELYSFLLANDSLATLKAGQRVQVLQAKNTFFSMRPLDFRLSVQ